MDPSQIYVLISILVLLIILFVVFFMRKDKKGKKLTLLVSFSLSFVLAGIVFGEDRLVSYSLMGIGVLLAVIDIVKKHKKKR